MNHLENSANLLDMGAHPVREEHRQSIMAVNNQNILETLKNKCFDRLKSKRKSMLNDRRKFNMQRLESESKVKRHVNEEIAQDTDMLDEIIRQEIYKIHQSDENNWSEEYD